MRKSSFVFLVFIIHFQSWGNDLFFDYPKYIFQHIHFENKELESRKNQLRFEDIENENFDKWPLSELSLGINDLKRFYQLRSVFYFQKQEYTASLKEAWRSKQSKTNKEDLTSIDYILTAINRLFLKNNKGAIDELKRVNWSETQTREMHHFVILNIAYEFGDFKEVKKQLEILDKEIANSNELNCFLYFYYKGELSLFEKNNPAAESAFLKSLSFFDQRKGTTLAAIEGFSLNPRFLSIQNQDSLVQSMYFSLSEINRDAKNFSKAKSCLTTITNARNLSILHEIKVYESKGIIATLEKKYDEANTYYLEAEKRCNKVPEKLENLKVLRAKNLFIKREYSQSIKLCLELLNTTKQNKNLMLTHHLLYQNYLQNEDFQNSQGNYQKYQAYKNLLVQDQNIAKSKQNIDAIEEEILENKLLAELNAEEKERVEKENLTIESQNRISDLKITEQSLLIASNDALFQKLEKERIAKDLNLLNQKLQIEKIRLSNEQLEKSKIIQELKTQKNKKKLTSLENEKRLSKKQISLNILALKNKKLENQSLFYGLIFTLFLLASILYFIYKNRIKNRMIRQKNEELRATNLKVAESIDYARHIQESLLPFDHVFEKHFQEHYIQFKPKDVVSGDCYVLQERNNKIYYAVMDCSGHGVAGVMLSSVATQALERFIERFEDNLQEIMNHMQTYFLKQLNKENEVAANGLDMTLFCIDKTSRKAYYTGAKGKFALCRNQEIQHFDTTRFSIGHKILQLALFEVKALQLEKEDVLYLYTDGISDQFDPETNKRLGSKGFNEFLRELGKLNFTEQKVYFDNFHARLTRENQTDDITFIATKI